MARQISPHKRTRDLVLFLGIGINMQIDHLNPHHFFWWVWLVIMVLIGWEYATTEDDS